MFLGTYTIEKTIMFQFQSAAQMHNETAMYFVNISGLYQECFISYKKFHAKTEDRLGSPFQIRIKFCTQVDNYKIRMKSKFFDV